MALVTMLHCQFDCLCNLCSIMEGSAMRMSMQATKVRTRSQHASFQMSHIFCLQVQAVSEAALADEQEAGFASEDDSEDDSEADPDTASAADMEDLAGPFSKQRPQQIAAVSAPGQPKAMLTPVLRASLSKQGYKLIGQPTQPKSAAKFLTKLLIKHCPNQLIESRSSSQLKLVTSIMQVAHSISTCALLSMLSDPCQRLCRCLSAASKISAPVSS